MGSNTYKDLVVWQKACDLAVEVYAFTANLPPEEKFGLSSQLQRAAVSIASNIAEGSKRGSRKDFSHFVKIALGSAAELETQLYILSRLSLYKKVDSKKANDILREVLLMLHSLSSKLSKN